MNRPRINRATRTFSPRFTLSAQIAHGLMRIEGAKQALETLPIHPRVIARLRQSARLVSTHYSTQIEGNRLTQRQVEQVIEQGRAIPGHERDQAEVLGYFAALDAVTLQVRRKEAITETTLQGLHALVMGGGRTRLRPTPYRDGQNVIREAGSRRIVYLPPEAKDVPRLMRGLASWINRPQKWPVPIVAAIAHYQYATIHPYYDGNGRTARLLATLILHLGGYDLQGVYELDQYYARDLGSYYGALTVGPSHNYYMGREEADITGWIEYFITGMAGAFENVRRQAQLETDRGGAERSSSVAELDSKQREALTLFHVAREITAKDVAKLFGYQPRTARLLCQRWVAVGFLQATNRSKKARKYALGESYTSASG